jgi:uncharacterized membrane protein
MIESFLIGVIATSSLLAALFFLKFWRETRDAFFLAFAASFTIEGLSRVAALFLSSPNHGSLWYYLVRLLAFLLILFAILRKNYGKSG